MSYPYYSPANPLTSPVELPPSPHQKSLNRTPYFPDKGLVDAINVALLLGQPLLVTGEAGTGKTQLAYHLAHHLGLPEPLKFETKSNSTAKDLFYFYDHLRHFQAAQTQKGSLNSRDYLTYNALGLAILRANPFDKIKDLVNEDFVKHHQATRSVVLIDEIDKAQRDFPNDILNEVEGMYFRIPELSNAKVQADLRPVLVLTSNSEKHLPAAFLRRCVYYHLSFPDDKGLTRIIAAHLGETVANSPFMADALSVFKKLRDSNLQKPPATAELLNWIIALQSIYPNQDNPLADRKAAITHTLSVLIKNEEDRKTVLSMIDRL
ncbi:MAG: MoxR family ATPase [Gallionella sp.]|nr:MoxR family ATPase [Gallionella sp.]MDD4960258.1 MoxR family ATPase [Gallionella sp.]